MKKEKKEGPLKQANMGGTNFLVTIYGQENMNLQGVIKWLDLDLIIHFRSTIEFLELIEEAVHLQNEIDSSKRTWHMDQSNKAI